MNVGKMRRRKTTMFCDGNADGGKRIEGFESEIKIEEIGTDVFGVTLDGVKYTVIYGSKVRTWVSGGTLADGGDHSQLLQFIIACVRFAVGDFK
jgi:hypothetical protein